MMVKWLAFLILHLVGIGVGAGLLWWFVLPGQPGEALADAITAGAVAGWAEIISMRLGWWQ
jgi:hypothetical protein